MGLKVTKVKVPNATDPKTGTTLATFFAKISHCFSFLNFINKV